MIGRGLCHQAFSSMEAYPLSASWMRLLSPTCKFRATGARARRSEMRASYKYLSNTYASLFRNNTTNNTAPITAVSSPSSASHTGPIVGGIVGGVVALTISGFARICLLRRRGSKHRLQAARRFNSCALMRTQSPPAIQPFLQRSPDPSIPFESREKNLANSSLSRSTETFREDFVDPLLWNSEQGVPVAIPSRQHSASAARTLVNSEDLQRTSQSDTQHSEAQLNRATEGEPRWNPDDAMIENIAQRRILPMTNQNPGDAPPPEYTR